MTSVSRSDSNDEAPEGTGAGNAEHGGRARSGRSIGARSRSRNAAADASRRSSASRSASARATEERGQAAQSAAARRSELVAESVGTETEAKSVAAVRLAERRAAARVATIEREDEVEMVELGAAAGAQSGRDVAPALLPVTPPFETVPSETAPPETAVPPEAGQTDPVGPEPVELEDGQGGAVPEPSESEPRAMAVGVVTVGAAAETRALVEPPPSEVLAPAATIVALPRQTERRRRILRQAREAPGEDAPVVLEIEGLVKRYGGTVAVDGLDLSVRAGSFSGIVGPNGAGKTTTLSMVTGLLRPDAGSVRIHGIDAWADPRAAKRLTGVLPDRLRTFDRLTGAQLLFYSGVLHGLDRRVARARAGELAEAFGLDDALDRLVADYSAGMTKKIALACAMIHAPRLLVLDEPFESVDPVSASTLTDVLERYVEGGGTVLLSSHSMDLIERVCDSAVVIIAGRVLASGTLDEVRDGVPLEDRFVELAGGRKAAEGMEWLHSFSD